MHIPLQWPRPPYLPQPLCSMDVRSRRVVHVERDHYIWNSAGTSETTGTLFYNFLSSSVFFKLSFLWFFFGFFCAWRHLLLLFSLYFLFSPPPHSSPSLFISPPTNLYASHAFTLHFPCWLWVSPLWRTLAFFIWVWKQCANIACLYPLGGIMAAITHWCSTKNWHFALLVLTNSIHLPLLCHSLFCFLQALLFCLFISLSRFCHLSLRLPSVVTLVSLFQNGIAQQKAKVLTPEGCRCRNGNSTWF